MRFRLPSPRAFRVGPLRGRRLAFASAAVAVGLAAGVVTGVQVRAAQAEDREQAAAAAAADRVAAADRAERAAAERRAQVEVEERWAAAAADAAAALAAADAALTASEGRVADDAVRLALASASTRLRGTLDAPPDAPTQDDVAELEADVAALAAATGAVTDAQAAWQAQQDAAAAAASPPPSAAPPAAAAPEPGFVPRGWPYDGAGPDCGSPASYEPATSAAAFFTSVPADSGDGSNGNLPRSAMAPLGWCTDSAGHQQWLRADAAAALTRLNEAFRARFGENIAVDMAYRSYADQVAIRNALGSIAAKPGTSNHGWGTAIDVWEWKAYAYGSERYDWLVANAPAYGWAAPAWARADGANPEYWHFEFAG